MGCLQPPISDCLGIVLILSRSRGYIYKDSWISLISCSLIELKYVLSKTSRLWPMLIAQAAELTLDFIALIAQE